MLFILFFDRPDLLFDLFFYLLFVRSISFLNRRFCGNGRSSFTVFGSGFVRWLPRAERQGSVRLDQGDDLADPGELQPFPGHGAELSAERSRFRLTYAKIRSTNKPSRGIVSAQSASQTDVETA